MRNWFSVRADKNEKRNIVGHIYIDSGIYASYSYYPLTWLRLAFLPLLLLTDLIFSEKECHLRKHKVVTYFAGYIAQIHDDLFEVVWYNRPVETERIWTNVCRPNWREFFPSYKHQPDYRCVTEEGDGVEYVPVSRAIKMTNLLPTKLTRKEFLEFTEQDEEHFRHNEYIKYTGM